MAALGLSSSTRDGLLFIPQHDPAVPLPLFVALHGAGGRAQDWLGMREMASDHGLVVLAPESRGTTWDRVHGAFGPDVAFLDRALTHVFECCSVDRRRIALGGFSDGASYALSLGLANGDLFTHVAAFSPGFVHVPPEAPGHPQVFVSHGLQDAVLPVWLSRSQVVPYLRERGYGVRYEEFDGGHEIPRGTLRSALEWLAV